MVSVEAGVAKIVNQISKTRKATEAQQCHKDLHYGEWLEHFHCENDGSHDKTVLHPLMRAHRDEDQV
jgi:hypothetical protein